MSAPVEPKPVSASRSELIRWMSVQDANSAGWKTCVHIREANRGEVTTSTAPSNDAGRPTPRRSPR